MARNLPVADSRPAGRTDAFCIGGLAQLCGYRLHNADQLDVVAACGAQADVAIGAVGPEGEYVAGL